MQLCLHIACNRFIVLHWGHNICSLTLSLNCILHYMSHTLGIHCVAPFSRDCMQSYTLAIHFQILPHFIVNRVLFPQLD